MLEGLFSGSCNWRERRRELEWGLRNRRVQGFCRKVKRWQCGWKGRLCFEAVFTQQAHCHTSVGKKFCLKKPLTPIFYFCLLASWFQTLAFHPLKLANCYFNMMADIQPFKQPLDFLQGSWVEVYYTQTGVYYCHLKGLLKQIVGPLGPEFPIQQIWGGA